MPFIHYFYVFLWAVLTVLCFFIGRKHGLVGYLLTVFFLFMSVWYGLEAFGGLPVFDGVMGHVFSVHRLTAHRPSFAGRCRRS